MNSSLLVYVAGSSHEVERIEKWSRALRSRGIVVTSTWPEVVRLNGNNPVSASNYQRARWSHDDLAGVAIAHVLWFQVPPEGLHTSEAWVELGYAVGRPIRIVLSGETKQSRFSALGEEYSTDESAFDAIVSLAGSKDGAPQ